MKKVKQKNFKATLAIEIIIREIKKMKRGTSEVSKVRKC